MALRGQHLPTGSYSGTVSCAQFQFNSYESITFRLQQNSDGSPEFVLGDNLLTGCTSTDVSSTGKSVHFRVHNASASTTPVDITLTKTNGGSDGIVSGNFILRTSDFTDNDFAIGALYIVNLSSPDLNTISQKVETLWKAPFPIFVKGFTTV